DWVNGARAEELADLFWRLGGVRESRRFARAIVHDRTRQKFATTKQLADLIERLAPRAGRRTHPATQVFQALRMAVNDELGSLKDGLEAAMKILKPGGRLAVITFHSAEDRLVKGFGREKSRDYMVHGEVDAPEFRKPRPAEMKWVTRKALKPGEAELKENPRSRSAQLRVLEKL
ncbi:MAG: 16S rRNA (cytosine(1402)-N(4))-methyltransferase RsmH, partial [Limisphaerales bacterium]